MSANPGGDLGGFEARLRQLEPLPEQLSRDRLLFEAGRRSAKAGQWRLATGLLGLACLGLAASHAVQFMPRTRPAANSELAARGTPAPTRTAPPPDALPPFPPAPVLVREFPKSDYVRQQERTLAKLLNSEAAPRSIPMSESPPRARTPLPPVEVLTWAAWAEKAQKRGF